MKKTIMEFSGSPEMLIALLYSDDVCQTIKDEVRASGKVTMFVFAEDEPCYTPDSDDIKPQGNLGDPVEDDLHYDEVAARELWSEADEERMDIVGSNGPSGLHYDLSHEGGEVIGA